MRSPSTHQPSAACASGRGPARHEVLLGDVLLDAYSSIDKIPGRFEDALLPGTRDQWKISIVSAAEIERAGPALVLPKEATHAIVFIEGNYAIEESGLRHSRHGAHGQTPQQLSLAAD